MMRKFFIFILALLTMNSLFLGQDFNEQEKTYSIPRANGKIKVDGNLDEKAWSQALKINLDIEVMPAENVEAPVKTECFLIFDENHIYVGFRAYDPEPQKIRAYLSDRDEMYSHDNVGILLDTFNDNNRAFVFFCNPLGIQGDEIMSQGGTQEDMSWDAIWNSAGNITDFGYVVEMAIPFRSLQFQPSKEKQVWGFTPVRNYPRSRRHQIAPFPIDRNNMQCLLCQLPNLKGFHNVTPGRNIELDPTITGMRAEEREDFPEGKMKKEDSRVDLGITGQWGLTNNLTLSAAANPDFSQVEADVAKLDINKQFALYYPEKRPFFLEGMDFFETPVQALYTRSVADPNYGLKLSGKEGKNVIGVFSAQDAITNLLFPGAEGSSSTSLNQNSYASVLRYRRDIGNASTLGCLLTDREGQNYHNRLAGVDGLLRFNQSDHIKFQFLGSQTAYPEETAQKFSQDPGELTGYGMHVEVSRQKRSYNLYGKYDSFSPQFRADLGFLPQVDYRKFEFGGGYMYWGKPEEFLSQFMISGNYDQANTHDGRLLEKELEASVMFQGPMQSMLNWSIGTREKTYQRVHFDQLFNHISFNIQPTGKFTAGVFVSFGDEIDYTNVQAGRYFSVSSQVRARYGKHLNLSLSHNYKHLNVEGGRLFLANISQLRFFYHLNARAYFRAILQYRDIDRTPELYDFDIDSHFNKLFSQLLFSYKLNPRTVFFLGYSDNYFAYPHIDLTQADRTFFAKIGYAWNL